MVPSRFDAVTSFCKSSEIKLTLLAFFVTEMKCEPTKQVIQTVFSVLCSLLDLLATQPGLLSDSVLCLAS